MWEGLTVLAVIPARGGSKGIPRKNLREVNGVSLIAHAARVARALTWIDAAVLSTDDAEMAEEGKRQGLEVPFLRPAELAGDRSSSVGMWQHAWRTCEAHYGRRFDLSILLQPTTPLRRPRDIERTLRAMVEGNHRAAATVSPLPAHFTPEKIVKIDARGLLQPYLSEGTIATLRQAIPQYYYRNGACYAVRRETLMDHGQVTEEDCAAVAIDEFVINIDEPFELEMADWQARGGWRTEDIP